MLSVLVAPLETSCAEAAVALAPSTGDLKPEDLLSPFHLMCLQKVKFVLNPVLPLCQNLGSLTRLGLCKFSIVILAYFH